MNCPACGNQLTQKEVSDVTVDVCKGGCGGIWFDNFELKKFDEPHESAGEELLDIERDESIVVDRNKRFKCPKCDDVVMMRHFYSTKKQVLIDQCPNCSGIWLDAGELRQIRSLFASEKEKNKAAEEYFSDIFKGDLAIQKVTGGSNAGDANTLANIFSFIYPR